MLDLIVSNQVLVLLAVIFLGYVAGGLKVKGIGLGSSACLFVAIVAGYHGAEIPPIIMNLGIIFFVYSIGLEAGPQFFHLFNRRGIKFAVLSIFTVGIGAATALLFAAPLHIDLATAAGVFAGAMTSTPALASAINAIQLHLPGQGGETSLAYAIAYPFGLISEVLFVQLVPRLFWKKVEEEKKQNAVEKEGLEFRSRLYRLSNENFFGKTIEEMDLHDMCEVNLTRFKRGDKIELCTPDTRLEEGDLVVAVGPVDELARFRVIFGNEVAGELPGTGDISIKDIFVSGPKVVGKSLRDLDLPETYGVSITRIYRGDTAITPTGRVVLETGDYIKVVGKKQDVDEFVQVAGSEKRRLDSTNIMILAAGMFVGAFIGEIPLVIGNFSFSLGMAGGPLFVALIVSHFGKIGRWSVRIPNATKFFIRELGLVLFLIGVGVKSGHQLTETIHSYNVTSPLILGVLVSLVSMFGSMFVVYNIFRVPLMSSLGALCGAKTSSPSLGILIKAVDDDTPALSYAAAYPVAIIMLTIVGQFMVFIGKSMLP